MGIVPLLYLLLGVKVEKKVEKITLPDGRPAERHITIDENGDRVIEVFAEEKRPLHLETRIKEKHKQVLAEQVIETIHDGQVVDQKIIAEPEKPLEVVRHIALANNPELNASRYLTKEDARSLIQDAVVTGVGEVLKAQSLKDNDVPVMRMQGEAMLENRVNEKKSNNLPWYIAIFIGAVVEVSFMAWFILH